MSISNAELARLTARNVPDDWSDLDQRAVDTIRVLAADAVQEAGNGHPGTAMSLAPTAYALYQALARQLLEVPMRGHLGDRVDASELRDRHGALALDALEDLFAT